MGAYLEDLKLHMHYFLKFAHFTVRNEDKELAELLAIEIQA